MNKVKKEPRILTIEKIAEHTKQRKLYAPNKIKVLFIAESPPENGYFYDKGSKKDQLIKAIIKAKRMKFGENFEKSKLTDNLKESYLKELEKVGWYLIDAVEKKCIAGISKNKEEIIKADFETDLKPRLDHLEEEDKINSETKIILLCATVFRALQGRDSRIKNNKQINFPITPHGSIDKMADAIKELL